MRRATLITAIAAMAIAGTAAAAYLRIHVVNESAPSGIFDPSLALPGSTGYMAYSGVNYHAGSDGYFHRDVNTRIAVTPNSGVTWFSYGNVNQVTSALIWDPGLFTPQPGDGICGGTGVCAGSWIHEVPFLVDDPTDVASRRYKLFAHCYFLYPPGFPADTHPELGTITMRAASSPSMLGSAVEETVFRWNASPIGTTQGMNINEIPALSECRVLTEGSGKSIAGQLYLTFACARGDHRQKIVLLRSFDHGVSWHYVSTPLSVADATVLGFPSFSASDIFLTDTGAFLYATPYFPDNGGFYAGCVLFRFADLGTGTLIRNANVPVPVAAIPTEGGRFGGACTYDKGSALGTLMIQLHSAPADGNPPDPFRIVATGVQPPP